MSEDDVPIRLPAYPPPGPAEASLSTLLMPSTWSPEAELVTLFEGTAVLSGPPGATESGAVSLNTGPGSGFTSDHRISGGEGGPQLVSQRLADRYELLGMLGGGAMGSVYRARDLELDEVVALKMLRQELVGSPGALQRFRHEVKLARRVTHHHVARVYDIGEHNGERFLTMEFIDGETLGARISREGPMALDRVVEIALAVCAGLSAAHDAGVVHRDLKPDNILLGRDGRVLITDFGIARMPREPGEGEGILVGTPAYMAPEQVEGTERIDARADLYALGAVLFEMLTGRCPWQGDDPVHLAIRRLSVPPPDPRVSRPDLAEGVAAVVMRCMARHREERYSAAEEVAQAVRSWRSLAAPPATCSSSSSQILPTLELPEKTRAIAVLPLRNLGGPEDAFLAEGLTGDLIDSLSMTRGLRVVSRAAVAQVAEKESDARKVGQALAVKAVLEGTVWRSGERLRVVARLVSVADGFQLWARRFDRSPRDLLMVGDEAATSIAEALSADRPLHMRLAPTDPAAIELYLKGRQEHRKMWRSSSERAADLMRRAFELAPEDPMILSGYALALARLGSLDMPALPGSEGVVKAQLLAVSLAERALALAPNLPEVRMALAGIRMASGDWGALATELRRALIAAPGMVDAQELYGRLLIELGHPQEGIARLNSALALEPTLGQARTNLARAYALMGDWERCDALLDHPVSQVDEQTSQWVSLSRVSLWRRDGAAALRALHKVTDEVFPINEIRLGLIQVLTDPASFQGLHFRLKDDALWLTVPVRIVAHMWQLEAEFFGYLENADRVLAALEAADEAQLIDILWIERCPLMDFVRGMPAFEAVRARIADRAVRTHEVLSFG